MLKKYLSFYQIRFYLILWSAIFLYALLQGAFLSYWPLLLIPILSMPFVEWGFHKFVLHFPIPKNSPRMKKWMGKIHYIHHENPDDLNHVVDPISFTLPANAILILGVGLISGSTLAAATFAVSSVACFLFYEWTHLLFHTEFRPLTAYRRHMKKHHRWHHYHNENHWWGITSNLGDLVLGTNPDLKQVPKSHSVKDLSSSSPENAFD